FDELFEALTWAQIGLHTKPIGLLNIEGYFNPLLALVDHAIAEYFIYPEHRQLIICEEAPHALLEKMQAYQPPENLSRWVERP
nr:LOG family protein [Anaerolineaceae bacterium]